MTKKEMEQVFWWDYNYDRDALYIGTPEVIESSHQIDCVTLNFNEHGKIAGIELEGTRNLTIEDWFTGLDRKRVPERFIKFLDNWFAVRQTVELQPNEINCDKLLSWLEQG